MSKTLLITGATDGIGLETARLLRPLGHDLLLHGRNPSKLATAEESLRALPGEGLIETHVADLSSLAETAALAQALCERNGRLDVLINNAGVFGTSQPRTADELDVRFAVNTVAPYLLTRRLLPLLGPSGRVVNLSSAAQSPVDLDALAGNVSLSDRAAYSQSKLAITSWSRSLALELGDDGPAVIAVNPGSLLGTKMVKQSFGVPGSDIGIGAEILRRAALDDDFAGASGQYFDNDAQQFGPPHPDALDPDKARDVVRVIETILKERDQGDLS
ncbi:MAG: SDR family NAD(P)-dependent oxidoreductase [Acidobacteriota bacterium]